MDIDHLKRQYELKKSEIKNRIEQFRIFGREAKKDDIFAEVAYCLCSPQTHFENCKTAIHQLTQQKLLFSADYNTISLVLKKNKINFYRKKANHIIDARVKLYDDGCKFEIKSLVAHLLLMPQRNARIYLWQEISGLGMKESSHFLRNIGHGDDLAILDTHILRKLYEFGVLMEEPKRFSITKYVPTEEKVRSWAKEIGIPLGELDLLLWSEETGEKIRIIR